eukprot:COSAG01_NODE_3968_length_5483_cov_4.305906_11_plen_102_part_00
MIRHVDDQCQLAVRLLAVLYMYVCIALQICLSVSPAVRPSVCLSCRVETHHQSLLRFILSDHKLMMMCLKQSWREHRLPRRRSRLRSSSSSCTAEGAARRA